MVCIPIAMHIIPVHPLLILLPSCQTLRVWGNNEELLWNGGSSHNVLERRTGPSDYTKVSQPTA